jgi:hypothetical protein
MFEECRVATLSVQIVSFVFPFAPSSEATRALNTIQCSMFIVFIVASSNQNFNFSRNLLSNDLPLQNNQKILSKQCVKSPFSPLEASSDHVKPSSMLFSPSTFFPAHFGLFRVFFSRLQAGFSDFPFSFFTLRCEKIFCIKTLTSSFRLRQLEISTQKCWK